MLRRTTRRQALATIAAAATSRSRTMPSRVGRAGENGVLIRPQDAGVRVEVQAAPEADA